MEKKITDILSEQGFHKGAKFITLPYVFRLLKTLEQFITQIEKISSTSINNNPANERAQEALNKCKNKISSQIPSKPDTDSPSARSTFRH